ncbi:HTH domain-containing protein [Aeromonas hydrophila]|uniref:HTH domain-containing protein n=1 Tax=Aeromonas hydrophila TaxID=644 RepID=UPI0030D3F651
MNKTKTKNNSTEKETENFTTVWDSVRRAKTVNGIQFKPIDKLLYSYLLGWQVSKDDPNNKKVTKVNSSVRELQQELGVSKGTIETSLKTLEKMGLIVIKSGGVGFSNEYDVIKFSDVESTNVEIKVDQFMENRKEWREQHNRPVVKPVEQPEQKQIEPKQPEIQINTQTNWFQYREKLIEQNDKWHELNVGQQQRLMSEIVECKNSNYIVIQDVFNRFISACFYTPTKNDIIQIPKQQPTLSIVPPAIQAMNDAFDDEGFPFSDDCPF